MEKGKWTMAKYQIAIQYNGDSEPMLKEFEIPDEAGKYKIKFELDDGNTFTSEIQVGAYPREYKISGKLTDGTSFDGGTFVTEVDGDLYVYKMPQYWASYRVGDTIGLKQYYIAEHPDTVFYIRDYFLLRDRELVELFYESVDLLQGDYINSNAVSGDISRVHYNPSTYEITIGRASHEVLASSMPLTKYSFDAITVPFEYTARFIFPQ